MKEKNKGLLNIYFSITAVLCIVCVIFVILNVERAGLFRVLSSFFSLLAITSGTYYVIYGYKKIDAIKLKSFLIFFCLSETMLILTSIGNTFSLLIRILMCLSILALIVIKDLGKNKSMILIYMVFIYEVYIFINLVILNPGILRGGDLNNSIMIVSAVTEAFSGLLAIFQIKGKYIDKQERGTK